MSRKAVHALIILALAGVAAWYAHRATSPTNESKHVVTMEAGRMTLPPETDGGGNSIYLRNEFELTQTPSHAWVSVIGHDAMTLFVNGELVDKSFSFAWSPDNALVCDITPYLKRGRNCVGVAADQRTLGLRASIAVEGRFHFPDGRDEALPSEWRCTDHFQQKGGFWYSAGFDDSHWRAPVVGPTENLRGVTTLPPRAITTPMAAEWIAPGSSGQALESAEQGCGAVGTRFEVAGSPRSAWLRIMSSAPCSVAFNGAVVLSDSDDLAVAPPYPRRVRLVDVSRYAKPGENRVAVMLTSPSETPQVACELEVEDRDGTSYRVASDASWVSAQGAAPDWMHVSVSEAAVPCVADGGPIGARDTPIPRMVIEAEDTRSFSVSAPLAWIVLMAIIAAVATAFVAAVNWLTSRLDPGLRTPDASILLVPPIAAGLMGMLATYDRSVVGVEVYQLRWLLLCGVYLFVGVGVLLSLAELAQRRLPEQPRPGRPPAHWKRIAAGVALGLIVAGGWFLRHRDMMVEPLHHDEVGAYFFTASTAAKGYPGGQVHPEMPFGIAATSELVYYLNAPFAWMFDDPRLVVRTPAVLWAVATIVLLYYVALRLFGVGTALIAATLYAVCPYYIGMANFGRYFSQLQFFALLTCYLYYKTIEGSGPVNRRALWGAVFALIATFLSWEAAAFMGLGMVCAALVYRRGSLRYLFCEPHVYAGAAVFVLVAMIQNAHRITQQIPRLWYGTGISDVSIVPMWRYPYFNPMFYLQNSSWTSDSLLPMIGLAAGACLAINHPRRGAVRVFLIILLVTCIGMSALLPLQATRYVYHVSTLTLLLSAAALNEVVRVVVRATHGVGLGARRGFSSLLAYAAAAIVLVVASGATIQTPALSSYQIAAFRPGKFKFPHWDEPLRFVRKNYEQGDIVISLYPHLTDMTMRLADDYSLGEEWSSDYWLQSVMALQATLSDTTPKARDRRAGTLMLCDREGLEQVFEENDRVWYLTIRSAHNHTNREDVSEFVRQNMDVVYEDSRTTVFFRDSQNRTAEDRFDIDEEAEQAGAMLLR